MNDCNIKPFIFGDVVISTSKNQPKIKMMVIQNLNTKVVVLTMTGNIYTLSNHNVQRISHIKYNTAKRKFLFSKESEFIQKNIRLDSVSLYSVTDQNSAIYITDIVRNLPHVTSTTCLIDGTSCIGGNTHAFADKFKTIYAVEIDPNRYEMLKYNMNLLSRKNVHTICNDILNIYNKIPLNLKDTIMFLDPPWGGTNYKQNEKTQLWLGNTSIVDICNKIIPLFKYVVLKIPYNFDFDHFKKKINLDSDITVHIISNRIQLLILKEKRIHFIIPSFHITTKMNNDD